MKTLAKIRDSVLEAVSAFNPNDDFPIPLLWIEDQVISQNHSLLRKAYSERRIDEHLYMLDELLEVQKLDKSFTVEGLPITNLTDLCFVELKKPVTGLRQREIEYVSNVGLSLIYQRVSIRRLLRGDSGYYSLNKPKYAVAGNKLYIRALDLSSAQYLTISAIWSDPRLVSSWTSDTIFPTPSEKNLELLTVKHIDEALRHNPDLFSDAQRAYMQNTEKK